MDSKKKLALITTDWWKLIAAFAACMIMYAWWMNALNALAGFWIAGVVFYYGGYYGAHMIDRYLGPAVKYAFYWTMSGGHSGLPPEDEDA